MVKDICNHTEIKGSVLLLLVYQKFVNKMAKIYVVVDKDCKSD